MLEHGAGIGDCARMKRRKKPRASTGLPTYVGVDEVCAALGISRPTLSRMRDEGKFPEPEQISPNRIGWPVDVIKAHLAAQFRSVARRGVTNPEDLKPDELAPTMRMLAARLLEQELGEPVRLEQVSLTLSKVATNDEPKSGS